MALVKIGFGLVSKTNQNVSKKSSTFAALGISDSKQQSLAVTMGNGQIDPKLINAAGRWELFNWWAKLVEIHSTHPLITKRVKAISNYCATYNQIPVVQFDKEAPEDFKNEFFKEVFIKYLSILTFIIGMTLFIYTANIFVGSGFLFLTGLFALIALNRRYSKAEREERTVASLLGEYNVSEVTSIPCTLRGTLIGKGQPGYIFASDFVVQDHTGIMYLDYKQPIGIMDFFFGAFKANSYIGKEVIARGWYRRGVIPYVQMESFEIDGVVKNLHAYAFAKGFAYFVMAVSIALPIFLYSI